MSQVMLRYVVSNTSMTIASFQAGSSTPSTVQKFQGGLLQSVSHFNSEGGLTTTSKMSANGLQVAEVDSFSKGILTKQQLNNANGQISSITSFDSSGKHSTDVLKFTYDANNHLTEIVKLSNGKVTGSEKFSNFTDNSSRQELKFDPASSFEELNEYLRKGNGSPTTPTAPQTVITTPTIAPVPAPAVAPTLTQTAAWNSNYGYGQINVQSALSIATGKSVADVKVSTAPTYISGEKFQDAWSAGYTGKGVVIADIDTGIDLKNSALTHNLSQYSWNFVSNSSNVQDNNGHGTCTAGEMIAEGNSKNSIIGAAYDAQLMVLKALDATGTGSTTIIANAISYAVNHGANVINMSLGTTSPDSTIQAAIQYASQHGVVCCMAAGNNGNSVPSYPAAYAKNYAGCIAVGADVINGTTTSLASFSNKTGSATAYSYVDADGSNVLGYTLGGGTANWSGTSMATPLVAAEAALLKSANSSLTASQIVQIIDQTANPLGVNQSFPALVNSISSYQSTAQAASAFVASLPAISSTPVLQNSISANMSSLINDFNSKAAALTVPASPSVTLNLNNATSSPGQLAVSTSHA